MGERKGAEITMIRTETVCDICKRPMATRIGMVNFKYKKTKRLRAVVLSCEWEDIDVCPTCIADLVERRKEVEK